MTQRITTMAITATFLPASSLLSVFGDSLDNTVTASRNAAGAVLVNGGAVAVTGGTPTVANTSLIQIFGQGGDDALALNEANGALPAANLFGGAGFLAATAATSSPADAATTRRFSAPATTPSCGIRATAATRSRARTEPTRFCSTARTSPSTSTSRRMAD